MRAMVLERVGGPLVERERATPVPAPGELLLAIEACAVCRTDLHVVDGELKEPKLPLVLGHQIVARIEAAGVGVRAQLGARVGVTWLADADGTCEYCRSGQENLCPSAHFTGYTRDGGYADKTLARVEFCVPMPEGDAAELAPLLCAGAIGYRSLRFAGDARRVGIYGFGAAAHVLAQVLVHQGRELYAFTRPGDLEGQRFAESLGARWAGGSDEKAPVPLDAALIFAPVGALVPAALAAVRTGGRVVCGGIHMSDVPSFPYALLWGERSVQSVANVTRADARELLAIAAQTRLHTRVTRYPLSRANQALDDLRHGRYEGAGVLVP
jgi:propanol-preferring alcohol dehydrogenase